MKILIKKHKKSVSFQFLEMDERYDRRVRSKGLLFKHKRYSIRSDTSPVYFADGSIYLPGYNLNKDDTIVHIPRKNVNETFKDLQDIFTLLKTMI